jgi:nucleoside-diphosphate-sugar epimerase
MKILVTGSEGNIGSILVPYLRNKGHDVFCIDIVQKFEDNFKTVDINDGADLIDVFYQFRPDVVYHMAAMVSRVTCEYSPVTTMRTNVYGTSNIVYLCKQINAKLIFFSTSEVFGNIGGKLEEGRTDLHPNNVYGLSKLMGEQLVTYESKNGLKAIIVRPFMFYHENETMGNHRSAIIRFVSSLIEKKKIEVHKQSMRSWMHLDDAVVVLEKLSTIDYFVILNIGNPEFHLMEFIAEKICDKLNIAYDDYVIETDLPKKMTLTKIADFKLLASIIDHQCTVSLDLGLNRVIESVKKRL